MIDFSDCVGLCVEDEPLVSIEMSKVLSELGFGKVLTAHRLSSAFEHLDANRIDMALLDYDLGYGERTTELALALEKTGASVLIASGYQKAELDSRLSHFPFVEKPAMDRALKAAITDLMADRT